MKVLLLLTYVAPTIALAHYTSASQVISVPQIFEISPCLRVSVLAVPIEGNAFSLGNLTGTVFLSRFQMENHSSETGPFIVISQLSQHILFHFCGIVMTSWFHLFTTF